MKFGNNIDLDWNQLQNARLQNLSSVPISKDSAEEGYIYYNTAQHRAQLYVKKVSGNSVVIDDWYNLLLGRENEIDPSWLQGGIGIGKLGCVLKDSDTNYLNSFAAGENTLIPTTGAVYGFFKDALKQNDAMVYMGTFAAQATSGVTLAKSMFTISGGGNPDNLTTWMSKGYTFKVTGSGYFGTIAVEAGDMIIVNTDSPGTTVSKYDVIQTNLTQYVTTFGGVSGAITLLNGQTTPGAINLTFPQNSSQLQASLVIGTPTMTWAGGATNGPTLNLSALSMTLSATIPSASSTESGVVTTGDQIFAGQKTFLSMVTLKRPFEGQNYDILQAGHRDSMLYFRSTSVEIASDVNSTAWHFYPVGYRNDGTADVTTMYPMQIAGLSGTSAPTGGLFFTGDKSYSGSDNSFYWGVNTRNPQYRLHVNGTFGAGNTTISGTLGVTGATTLGSTLGVTGATTLDSTLTVKNYINLTGAATNGTKRIYFGSTTTGSPYLEWDSTNNALHAVNMGFYADSWVASGGIGSGSGGSGGGSNIQLLNRAQCNALTSASAGEGKAAAAWAIKELDTDYSSKYNNLNASISALRQDVNSISASGVVSVSSPTASNTGYLVTSVTKASDSTAISVTKVDIGSYSLTLNGGTAVSLIKTGSGNSSASFFAPTTVGTAGYYLKSNGSGAPTWDGVRHIDLSSISDASSLNTMISSPGLEVRRLGNVSDAPSSYSYGSVVQWSRYVDGTGSSVNTASQLYVPYQQNKLYFRNSWATGHSPTGDEWKPWLEVATIGTNGNFETALGNSLNTALNNKFIHTYDVGRSISGASSRWDSTNSTTGYKTYTTVHAYDNSNLIVALYDNENKLVMTDVEIHLYDGSTESYVGKYGVRLSFAKPFPTGVTYKLVVYGTQNS